MSFLNYGSSKGLAYRHDFGSDMDRLYEQEKFRAQTKAQKEEKVRYYSTLLKQHNPVSPGIVKGLGEHVSSVNNELAEFAINNPNWEQDPGLFAKFQGITEKYMNNDYVRNDLKSQEQLEILRQNRTNMPEDEFIREMDRYNEFYQNGGDPYVFNGRIDPTYDDIFATSAQRLEASASEGTYQNKDSGLWYNVTDINRGADPNKNSSMREARIDFSDPAKKRVIDKRFAEYNEQNPGIYNSSLQFHAAMLENSYGRKNTLMAGQMSNASSGDEKPDPYMNLWFNQNIASGAEIGKVIAAQDNMEAFLHGWRGKGESYTPQSTDRIYVKEEDGSFEQIQLAGSWELMGLNNLEWKEDNGYLSATVKSAQPTTADSSSAGIAYNIKIGDSEYKGSTVREIFDAIAKDYTLTNTQRRDLEEEIKEINKSGGFGVRNTTMQLGRGRDKVSSAAISVSTVADPTLTAKLEQWGFQSQGIVNQSQISNPMQAERVTYPTFSGTIYVPMNITPQTISAYEQSYGVKHSDSVLASGAVANIQNTFNNMISSAVKPGIGGRPVYDFNKINATMDFLTQNLGGDPIDVDLAKGETGIVRTPFYINSNDNRIIRRTIDFEGGTEMVEEYDPSTGQVQLLIDIRAIDKEGYKDWYVSNKRQIYRGILGYEGE